MLYRFVGYLTGGLSEVSMRLVAIACVTGALPGVYVLLRDEFDRDAATIGTLAVWAQPVVAGVAFDARFYGPWLLGIVMLLLAVRATISGRGGCVPALGLALASAFVCTIHYFGIVSWLAALGVGVLRASRPEGIRRLAPALAGPLILSACIPIYLGQRAALSIPTWIPRASVVDHLFLLAVALLPAGTVAALGAWGASRLLEPVMPRGTIPPRTTLAGGTWLLVGQAAVPLILAAFSLLVQPSTQPRYWIAGSLFAAPVVALAASRSHRVIRWAVGIALVLISATIVKGEGFAGRERQERLQEDARKAARATADGSMLVVRRRHTLYPLLRAVPTLGKTAALLDASTLHEHDRGLAVVERDVASVHQRFYGFPRIVSPAELEGSKSFYFLEIESTRTPTTAEFPGYDVREVEPRVFHLERHHGP
jgi:hypothetical protein